MSSCASAGSPMHPERDAIRWSDAIIGGHARFPEPFAFFHTFLDYVRLCVGAPCSVRIADSVSGSVFHTHPEEDGGSRGVGGKSVEIALGPLSITVSVTEATSGSDAWKSRLRAVFLDLESTIPGRISTITDTVREALTIDWTPEAPAPTSPPARPLPAPDHRRLLVPVLNAVEDYLGDSRSPGSALWRSAASLNGELVPVLFPRFRYVSDGGEMVHTLLLRSQVRLLPESLAEAIEAPSPGSRDSRPIPLREGLAGFVHVLFEGAESSPEAAQAEARVRRDLFQEQPTCVLEIPLHVAGTAWASFHVLLDSDTSLDRALFLYRDVIPTLLARTRRAVLDHYLRVLRLDFNAALRGRPTGPIDTAEVDSLWRETGQAFPFAVPRLSPESGRRRTTIIIRGERYQLATLPNAWFAYPRPRSLETARSYLPDLSELIRDLVSEAAEDERRNKDEIARGRLDWINNWGHELKNIVDEGLEKALGELCLQLADRHSDQPDIVIFVERVRSLLAALQLPRGVGSGLREFGKLLEEGAEGVRELREDWLDPGAPDVFDERSLRRYRRAVRHVLRAMLDGFGRAGAGEGQVRLVEGHPGVPAHEILRPEPIPLSAIDLTFPPVRVGSERSGLAAVMTIAGLLAEPARNAIRYVRDADWLADADRCVHWEVSLARDHRCVEVHLWNEIRNHEDAVKTSTALRNLHQLASRLGIGSIAVLDPVQLDDGGTNTRIHRAVLIRLHPQHLGLVDEPAVARST